MYLSLLAASPVWPSVSCVLYSRGFARWSRLARGIKNAECALRVVCMLMVTDSGYFSVTCMDPALPLLNRSTSEQVKWLVTLELYAVDWDNRYCISSEQGREVCQYPPPPLPPTVYSIVSTIGV